MQALALLQSTRIRQLEARLEVADALVLATDGDLNVYRPRLQWSPGIERLELFKDGRMLLSTTLTNRWRAEIEPHQVNILASSMCLFNSCLTTVQALC